MSIDRSHRPLLLWACVRLRFKFVGVVFGALFFCLSLTPSLLPRDWLFQGLIGGVNRSFGYGLGVLIGNTVYRVLLRNARWWPPSPRVLFWLKAAIVVIAPTSCVLMPIPAAAWQREVSRLMGIDGPTTPGYLRTLLVAVGVGAILVSTFRVLIEATRLLARILIRRWHLHDEVALFIGTAIVVALLITLIDGVLVRGFFAGASAIFQPQYSSTAAGISQPLLAEKSGSPASLAPLGHAGISGPHIRRLRPARGRTEQNQRPTRQRTRPGVRRAAYRPRRPGTVGRTRRRARAHQRVHPQGSGDRADHRHRLDRPGGREFTGDDVRRRHRDRRPSVFFSAELEFVPCGQTEVHRLRSHADQRRARSPAAATARTPAEVGALRRKPGFDGRSGRLRLAARHRTDGLRRGAVGRAAAGELAVACADRGARPGQHRSSAALRQRANRAVLRRHRSGRRATVRRATMGGHPRAVPAAPVGPGGVVSGSPDLLFGRPDWLVEPRGADRSAAMLWNPVVTFWQVGADLTNAGDVPGGHGHNYSNDILDGWAAVTPPDGWTSADTERIRAAQKA